MPQSNLISVVIPTRNRLDLLSKCLASLAKQTYQHVEVLIGNDAGDLVSDNFPAVQLLRSQYGNKRVTILNYKAHKGHRIVRNELVKKARGSIIVFTDDDAILDKNWLKSIHSYFVNHPGVTAVNGKIQAVSLATPNERIRQAYYNYRDQLYSKGILDASIKHNYSLTTDESSLVDWLSLGNCAMQSTFARSKHNLFAGEMKLNYGRKLGREMLLEKKLVTYSPKIIIQHHHSRSLVVILKTRLNNGRNFCLIDDEERQSLRNRFSELIRYFSCIYSDNVLKTGDKVLESGYSIVFLLAYLFQKLKNSVESAQ